jgi:serine/threonine protein kinase
METWRVYDFSCRGLGTSTQSSLQDNVLITERHGACLSGFRQSVRLSSRDAACPQSQMPPKPAIQFAGPEWFVRRDDAIFQHLPKTLFRSDIYSLGCVIFYVRLNTAFLQRAKYLFFQIYAERMPWHDGTSSVEISNQLRNRVTPPRPKGAIVDDNQWALIEPCLSLLPRDRPSASDVLKRIKDYLVFIGPPNLTGQIKRQRDYADDGGGFGSVYKSTWNRKTGGQVEVTLFVFACASG